MNQNQDPKLMAISDAARAAKTTPQVINGHIRKGNITNHAETGKRLVNIDEVLRVVASGKRTKKGTKKSADLHREFGISTGTILYTVTEVRRRVATVNKMTQVVVEVKNAHDQSKWSGVMYKASNLMKDISEGHMDSNNDIANLLKAMARSAKGRNDLELFEDLKGVYMKHKERMEDPTYNQLELPESAILPETETDEEE